MFVIFAQYKNDLQTVAQVFGNKGTLFIIKRSPTASCIKYIGTHLRSYCHKIYCEISIFFFELMKYNNLRFY